MEAYVQNRNFSWFSLLLHLGIIFRFSLIICKNRRTGKCVCRFFLQLFFLKSWFAAVNIQRFAPEVWAVARAGLHVQCSTVMTDVK